MAFYMHASTVLTTYLHIIKDLQLSLPFSSADKSILKDVVPSTITAIFCLFHHWAATDDVSPACSCWRYIIFVGNTQAALHAAIMSSWVTTYHTGSKVLQAS